jgi:hypothetical protein
MDSALSVDVFGTPRAQPKDDAKKRLWVNQQRADWLTG